MEGEGNDAEEGFEFGADGREAAADRGLTSQGRTIGQARREASIWEQSYFRWRKEYGGLPIEQAKRLKDLEKENVRLKRLVADHSFERVCPLACELRRPHLTLAV